MTTTYLSVRQVRGILGVSRPTVRRLIDSGELKAIKGPAPNSPLKIDETSLHDYIERHEVEPEAVEVAV